MEMTAVVAVDANSNHSLSFQNDAGTSLHFFLFVSRLFLYGFFYTVLNALQYFNNNVQIIDITRIMII